MVVIDQANGRAVGTCAFLRIDPANGAAELGTINWSPLMKRSALGSEAIFLMLRHLFDDLGYRRCEWKCDSLNLPSRQAAERFGFRYEGTFRQAVVVKGRTRDTDWLSIIDGEWPALRSAFAGLPARVTRQAFRPSPPGNGAASPASGECPVPPSSS